MKNDQTAKEGGLPNLLLFTYLVYILEEVSFHISTTW